MTITSGACWRAFLGATRAGRQGVTCQGLSETRAPTVPQPLTRLTGWASCSSSEAGASMGGGSTMLLSESEMPQLKPRRASPGKRFRAAVSRPGRRDMKS